MENDNIPEVNMKMDVIRPFQFEPIPNRESRQFEDSYFNSSSEISDESESEFEEYLDDISCPLLQRRSVTSYGEFPSIPPVRAKSARYSSANLTMPRGHVSVARFYDWSEDLGDCISVSKLYRDLASVPRFGDRGKSKDPKWASNGIRVIPGRMFTREKGSLTKGEREIIDGITRNRGENLRDVSRQDSTLRSHHDAWLVGRGIPKRKPDEKNSLRTSMDESEFKVPDTLFKSPTTSDDSQTTSKETSCYFCTKEQHEMRQRSDTINSDLLPPCQDQMDLNQEGPTAPPSTPDKLLQKRTRDQGWGSTNSSFVHSDSFDSISADSPRKVRVNVYLPAMAADQTEEDIGSCLLHGRALIRKERPLSQTEFKLKDKPVSHSMDPKVSTPRLSKVSIRRDGSVGGDGKIVTSKQSHFELSE